MKRLILSFSAVIAISLLCAASCNKARLEPGGAYATIGTNGVAEAEPDLAFYQVDASFDLAHSTVLAAAKFERDNRALLWKVSPEIKRALDKLRPQVVEVRDRYVAARAAYILSPTPAGLGTLDQCLSKMQALSSAVEAALPKSP